MTAWHRAALLLPPHGQPVIGWYRALDTSRYHIVRCLHSVSADYPRWSDCRGETVTAPDAWHALPPLTDVDAAP